MSKTELKVDDYSIEYFIDMIGAFINRVKPQAKQRVNWDEVLYLSQIHSLTGLLGYMSQMESSEFKPNEKLAKSFLNIYIYNLQLAINRNLEFKEIIDELCRNKIPHILMKGYVIQNYYQQSEIRSMGDIDFVVHEEDAEKTDKILVKLGYVFEKKVGFVNEYSKGRTRAEVHTKLFSSTDKEKNSDIIEYFNSCWDNAFSTDNGYSYMLIKEYHLLFLLSHMAKHFSGGGCGIRMIIDIAVFLKHFSGQLKFDYLIQELDKINLTQFAVTIFRLCNLWFNTDLPECIPELRTEVLNGLRAFIIKRGTFGKKNKNALANEYRITYEKNQGKNRFLLNISTFITAVFPSVSTLKHYYPKAKKGFVFIIIAWFKRTYELWFGKKNYSKKLLRDIKNASCEANSIYKLLKDIGL